MQGSTHLELLVEHDGHVGVGGEARPGDGEQGRATQQGGAIGHLDILPKFVVHGLGPAGSAGKVFVGSRSVRRAGLLPLLSPAAASGERGR